jgi:hypothetical protein
MENISVSKRIILAIVAAENADKLVITVRKYKDKL